MKRLPSVDLSQFPALFQPVITRDPTPEELARIQSAKRRAWHVGLAAVALAGTWMIVSRFWGSK